MIWAMKQGLSFLGRGLWALAGVIGTGSLGLVLADHSGMLAPADSPLNAPAEHFSAEALPQGETAPLLALTGPPPPVVIPIEFGPSPGRTLAPPEPVPLPSPPIPAVSPAAAPTPAVQVAVAPKPPQPKQAQPKPEPAALPLPRAIVPRDEASSSAEAILISVAERRLRVVLADGSAKNFPIAVGRSRDLIPIGTTEVLRKRRNPTWVPTLEMRRRDPKLPASVPPGPRNPMGLYALDLGWTYYRIHGTNEPQSIGRAASSGCFRMLPKDIEAVFNLVDIGTKVTVIEGRLPKLPDPAPSSPAPSGPAPSAPAAETEAL